MESKSYLSNTPSLAALHNDQQRKILDLVDRLRHVGLSSTLNLPQLVVCGDQSSGKSSVLEAITEIPFPRKENLCTRFATEIIMRRDPINSISCKISPDKDRPENEQKHLSKFHKTINSFQEVGALIEEATTLMGLSVPGVEGARAFSRDVLSIEICGPDRLQLTLVDLPGLVHSENKSQTKQDVQLIRELVDQYITNGRTIILAVITAKNDYANQIILEKARNIDPKGTRTLGIITKPDFLSEGSENQKLWLDLASNKDIHFELGWHILKNRGEGEEKLPFTERNANERKFFSSGKYREIAQRNMGIDHLRSKLSTLLFQHLKKELPELKMELDFTAQKTSSELERIGESRSSPEECKNYLLALFNDTRELITQGVRGLYDHRFFQDYVDSDDTPSINQGDRFLRAVVQDFNIKFSKLMAIRGRKYCFPRNETSKCVEFPEIEFHHLRDISMPKHFHYKDAIRWATEVIRKRRGRELPGVFNDQVVGHLFWEQSSKWETCARMHLRCIVDVCHSFVQQVLGWFAAPRNKEKIFSNLVEPDLNEARQNAFKELDNIVADLKRHPITYNHYFIDTLQKLQQEKLENSIQRIIDDISPRQQNEAVKGSKQKNSDITVNRTTLTSAITSRAVETDLDTYAAEQALHALEAYYTDERKYFVNAVAKQVIERHLLQTLPSLFSSNKFLKLTTEEIRDFVAESDDVSARRKQLQSQMAMLESGQEEFRRAMRG